MDPRPVAEDIPSLYVNYYTHGQPIDLLAIPGGIRFASWRHALKMGLVNCGLGYDGVVKDLQPFPFRLLSVLSRLEVARRWAGRIVRFLPARSGGRLLDVGCGNGSFLWLMSRLGWDVSGLEMDPQAAGVARQFAGSIQCGRVEDLPDEEPCYDAITLSHVLEHMPDPAAVLLRLTRMLRPRGVLVSISPNPESTIASLFRGSWRGLEPPRHLVLPSARGYEGILRGMGLEIEIFTSMNGAPGMIQDSISIQRTGRWGNQESWIAAKLIAYLLLPVLKLFTSRAGEELICIARRPA